MLEQIKSNAETRMRKAIDTLHAELAKLRTGRAHPSLIEHIKVVYHGNNMPLNQVASITIADARTLIVMPWEKDLVLTIEKALLTADLGLNPVTAGTTIRVPLPPLTEQRRKEMIKVVKSEAENARVSVRTVRRDANTQLKDLLKDKKISEDDERRAQDNIQKLTDKYIADIEKVLGLKETELLEV